jgi:hypothetical protein
LKEARNYEKKLPDYPGLSAIFTGNRFDPGGRRPVDDKLLLALEQKTFMLSHLNDLFAASPGINKRKKAYYA